MLLMQPEKLLLGSRELLLLAVLLVINPMLLLFLMSVLFQKVAELRNLEDSLGRALVRRVEVVRVGAVALVRMSISASHGRLMNEQRLFRQKLRLDRKSVV